MRIKYFIILLPPIIIFMLMTKRATTFVLILTRCPCVLPSLLFLCIERRKKKRKYEMLEENKWETKQIINADDVPRSGSKWLVI